MKKFFEGLSISSIVAGALAAVTSFLLASKIGIAGSVIGAAASYIVSAVATNIYQNVLQASGEKLQSVGSTDDDAAEHGESDAGSNDSSPTSETKLPAASGDAADAQQSDDIDRPARVEAAASENPENTMVAAAAAGETTTSLGTASTPATREATTGLGTASAPAAGRRTPREVVSRPTAQRSRHTYSVKELRASRRNPKRTAVIVTVVSGLLAVAVTAGIVLLITQGNGTDSVVRDWISPTVTTPSPEQTESPSTPQHTPTDNTNTPKSNGTTTENDSAPSGSSNSDSSSGSTDSSGSTGTGSGNTNTESGTNSGTETNGNTNSGTGGNSGSNSTGSDASHGSGSSTNSGTTGSSSTGSGNSTGSPNSKSSSSSTSSSAGTDIDVIGE
ncbi:hypothetical protein BBM1128_00020 [Bifidobacterium breve MCC 1128]|uniref:Uncharacterized protein n=1 Tax=Bifidobacterium breve MCC 1128 TaxID=1365965 RepID=A0A0L7B790_BIFBR|nr:hypothetical protein [Bifidobacterium breve]KOA43335.1 hypothetical protein BBM1128_00020 [Bifidobacterium breve MCC 1128]